VTEEGGDVAEVERLFEALARSRFRSGFRLNAADARTLAAKGLPAVLGHAAEFIAARLAPAQPANDGKQTPMRGHPAFVAQHATASCCRSCLAKWHKIPASRAMSDAEQAVVLAAIERWLRAQPLTAASPGDQPRLL
jgi:hypothetical protein